MQRSDNILSTDFPSLNRLRKLLKAGQVTSLVRALQYEQLLQIEFNGDLLDVGGGEKAHYRLNLTCASYSSINISSEMKPTWIADAQGIFPIADASFDHVLSMNTFEHVFDAGNLIKEATRALRPGGTFVAATPFLFRIHGSPDDYFRPTASWWIKSLKLNGYKKISVKPLLWGPFSTGAICSGMPGGLKRLRLTGAMLLDHFYARLKYRDHFVAGISNSDFQNAPLAYFVHAVKS